MTTRRCDGVARRNFIRVGGLTALGLGMGNYFQLQRAMAARPLARTATKAKSCILIWLQRSTRYLESIRDTSYTRQMVGPRSNGQ